MTINQRVLSLINLSNFTKDVDFAKFIGVTKQVLSSIKHDLNSPSADTLVKILSAYPNIDARWLLTGEGDMYIGGGGDTKHTQTVTNGNGNVQHNGNGNVVVRSIGECERECDGLRKEVVNLQDKIAMKDEIIAGKNELINQLKNK